MSRGAEDAARVDQAAEGRLLPRLGLIELVGDVLHGVAPPAVVVELVAHLACELHVRGLELGFAAAGAAASARGPQPVAVRSESRSRSNSPTAPSTAKNMRPAVVDVSICC